MTNAGNSVPLKEADILRHSDRAQDWLIYLYSDDADDDGRAKFSAWLDEDPAHSAAFAQANNLWNDITLIDGIEEGLPESDIYTDTGKTATISPLSLKKNIHKTNKINWTWVASIAACILLVVMVVKYEQSPTSNAEHYASAIGERETIILADGSKVTLGAASEIAVSLTNVRDLELLRGNAYFEVARDETRPFRVRVGKTEVRVLGTKFDVRRGVKTTRIAVVEGLVEIAETEKENTIDTERLTVGQEIAVTAAGKLQEVQVYDPQIAFSWLEGRLVYDNVPLREVLLDVNRYRTKKITLADDILGEIRITTSFRADESDRMLAGLMASKPLTMLESEKNIIIYSKE